MVIDARSRSARRPRGAITALRVVIVDDHPIVREGLRQLIGAEADMCVCGESDNAAHALDLIRRERPDVAIVDLSLGRDSGLELVRAITAQCPDVRQLVLSMHDELLYGERALRAGARGYVMKHGGPADLLTAIRRVGAGKAHVSAELAARLINRVAGRSSAAATLDPAEALSDRELQVFERIGGGLATKDIAAELFVSVKTVESHVARMKEKLGVRTGRQLVRLAVSWVESPGRHAGPG